ncbi:hypothetical protein CVT26_008710, partial [Gymnopilus dilepis]
DKRKSNRTRRTRRRPYSPGFALFPPEAEASDAVLGRPRAYDDAASELAQPPDSRTAPISTTEGAHDSIVASTNDEAQGSTFVYYVQESVEEETARREENKRKKDDRDISRKLRNLQNLNRHLGTDEQLKAIRDHLALSTSTNLSSTRTLQDNTLFYENAAQPSGHYRHGLTESSQQTSTDFHAPPPSTSDATTHPTLNFPYSVNPITNQGFQDYGHQHQPAHGEMGRFAYGSSEDVFAGHHPAQHTAQHISPANIHPASSSPQSRNATFERRARRIALNRAERQRSRLDSSQVNSNIEGTAEQFNVQPTNSLPGPSSAPRYEGLGRHLSAEHDIHLDFSHAQNTTPNTPRLEGPSRLNSLRYTQDDANPQTMERETDSSLANWDGFHP